MQRTTTHTVILRLHNQGSTAKEIAATVGMTTEIVRAIIAEATDREHGRDTVIQCVGIKV